MSRSPLLAAAVLALALGPLGACGATTTPQASAGTGSSTSTGIVLHSGGTKGGRCVVTHDSKGKRPGGGRFAGSKAAAGAAHTSGGKGGRCATGARDATVTSHSAGGSVG